jgi:hypothetical protein
MENGYTVICPKCQSSITEFSLADEWSCECGESGVLEYDDDEELDDWTE